jgi:hypothetical protein
MVYYVSVVEQLCIDASLIGTEKHMLVDDNGYCWSTQVPSTAWHLSGMLKPNSDRCLDTLAKLADVDVDVLPPSRFVNAMNTIIRDSSIVIPWSKVMPDREHRTFVKKIINTAIEILAKVPKNYYVNTWCPESLVFKSLVPACVDTRRWKEINENQERNNGALKSFCPDEFGHADVVRYNRFGTRTGRLTVQAGPDILTLNKLYRDVIVPSRPGGKIVYVDFSALEARILLYEAGEKCDDGDLYAYISRELFAGSAPRSAIKQAVISELYGSGKYNIGKELGISGRNLDEFINKIKSLFRTKELLKRVKSEFIKTGKVVNHYGRRLVIDEPLDNIFINTYAQSIGVDICLLGFSDIIRHLAGTCVRPIFVLHDALLLDVPPQDINSVLEISSVTVPGYDNVFPVKCEFIERDQIEEIEVS